MQKHFVRRGVSVSIPDQDREFVIEDKRSYDPELMYKTNGFELVRLVINVGVSELKGDRNGSVTLDPPMELVVALTAADLAHLDEDCDPKLAFWHPDNKEWVVLDARVDGRGTKLAAEIYEWWPDPGVGVGR